MSNSEWLSWIVWALVVVLYAVAANLLWSMRRVKRRRRF